MDWAKRSEVRGREQMVSNIELRMGRRRLKDLTASPVLSMYDRIHATLSKVTKPSFNYRPLYSR